MHAKGKMILALVLAILAGAIMVGASLEGISKCFADTTGYYDLFPVGCGDFIYGALALFLAAGFLYRASREYSLQQAE